MKDDELKQSILKLLAHGKALDFFEISRGLGYTIDDDNKLAEKLTSLVNDYTLYLTNKGRYMLFKDNEKNQNYVKGKFLDTNSDYGFVRIEGMDDVFIHGSKTLGALNGDTVLVYLTKRATNERKMEGQIVKIIEREINNKVGEVYFLNGKLAVSLDDKKFKKIIYLNDSYETRNLKKGDKIIVSFDSAKMKKDAILAKFEKRIGNINDYGIEVTSIVADHGIESEFPEDVLREAGSLPDKIDEKDLEGRRDLRDKMIFTIDGDDTKDIDDAISYEKMSNGNFKLGVHIADVSYYVKENSSLDMEARRRGTSVYLIDRVIPMYPVELSNGICSLNPDVDRLAISCEMEITPEGRMVDYDIFPSVIHSRCQMTYKNVNKILEENIIPLGYEEFADTLRNMNNLAHIIRNERTKRGAIDFDIPEAKILADDIGRPTDVLVRDMGEGQRLIEDFMVRANETVASHFSYMDLPSLYRIHGMPDEDRLAKFLRILGALGISVKTDVKKMNPKVIQKIVEELRKYPEYRILCQKLLSCMDKAIYSPENIGHFALASKIYTHFTSPIRRYPDTTIHRLLHNYFFSKDGITEEKVEHFKEILGEIAMHSSEMERNSEECERDVEKCKMAEYMNGFIGQEFEGRISGVMNYGFYVQLDNMIEGLVLAGDLPGYEFDGEIEIAKTPNETFKLGERILVRIKRASKEDSQIDFEFVERVDSCEKVKKKY